MSGLRRVGKLRKGMRVEVGERQAVILGFPTRNMVSLRFTGGKETTRIEVNRFTRE